MIATDPSLVSQEAREVRSIGGTMRAHSGRRRELIGMVCSGRVLRVAKIWGTQRCLSQIGSSR